GEPVVGLVAGLAALLQLPAGLVVVGDHAADDAVDLGVAGLLAGPGPAGGNLAQDHPEQVPRQLVPGLHRLLEFPLNLHGRPQFGKGFGALLSIPRPPSRLKYPTAAGEDSLLPGGAGEPSRTPYNYSVLLRNLTQQRSETR